MKRKSIPTGIWGNALAAAFGLILVAANQQSVVAWLILVGGAALAIINFISWRRRSNA